VRIPRSYDGAQTGGNQAKAGRAEVLRRPYALSNLA